MSDVVETRPATDAAPPRRRRSRRPRLLVIGPLPPPFIGPAIATRRLLDSPVLARHFDIDHVDTGDPEGFDDIGTFGLHNVTMALRHGWGCLRVLVGRRPDAIYVPIARGLWGFVRDLLFLVPARLLGTRAVVHLRAGRFDIIHDNGRLGRAIARFGLRGVDRALVLGSTVGDVFGDAVDAQRVAIVPNGVNLEGWDHAEWSRARSGRDVVRIAYIANLYYDKGIHVMIEAMALLRRTHPHVRVAFAGDWGNAGYRESCTAAVREHGLDDVVEFVGRVDEAGKKRLLAGADLAVFVPVKPEGLPWVVIEAMAAALPVIGSPQGTIPELIVDGASGYLVAVDDAAALAARVAELADDPDRRARMGAAGRTRVEEIYCEERTHARLAGVILEVIERKENRTLTYQRRR